MSDVVDAKSLFGKFSSLKELTTYAEELFLKLQASTEMIQKQQQEIEHLQGLLKASHPDLSDIQPEMLLCEMEIKRLQLKASMQELSFEEAKKFDIFNKNLLAIRKSIAELSADKEEHSIDITDEKTLLAAATKPSDE